jgi:Inosine-uridine preferring nucleoside hydrolase
MQPQSHDFGAIGAMYAALSTYPGAWIIATGALTNVSLLFAVYPHLVHSIGGVSIMGGAVGGFFTHAPMGELSERLQLKKHLHRDFTGRLPDDSNTSIEEVARHFRELGILEGTEDLEDERVHLLLQQARVSFGNQSEFAEFNVSRDGDPAIECARLTLARYT